MSQPSDTAITDIGAQKIAVLAGGPMVKNGPGMLAIVDVTNFLQPELLNVIELEGGWGTHLALPFEISPSPDAFRRINSDQVLAADRI